MSLYREMRDDWERETLQAALVIHGSVKEAARALGVNRTWLHRKLIQLGIREKGPWRHPPPSQPGNWAQFGL